VTASCPHTLRPPLLSFTRRVAAAASSKPAIAAIETTSSAPIIPPSASTLTADMRNLHPHNGALNAAFLYSNAHIDEEPFGRTQDYV